VKGCKETSHILRYTGDIIRIHTLAEKIDGKQLHKVRQQNDSVFLVRSEISPVPEMFFRPEENHGASGIARVFHPFHERDRHVPDYLIRLGLDDFAVLDFHDDRLPTIQTGRIDANGFSRKEPADRQRLERSLAEPLLLAINRDAELILKAVERSKRHKNVGLGIHPPGYSGVNEVVKRLSPLLNGNTQFTGYLRVMRRLPRFHKPFQDD